MRLEDGYEGLDQHLEYPQKHLGENAGERTLLLIRWAINYLDYTSMLRLRHFALCRLADLFQAGEQGSNTPEDLGFGGPEFSFLFQPDPLTLTSELPARPVLNEFRDAIQNEAARINKGEFAPTIKSAAANPTYQQRNNARKATKIIRSELKRLGFAAKRRQTSNHLPLYGGAWAISEWYQSLATTTRVPRPNCAECPQCEKHFAGPGKDGGAEHLGYCPSCEDHEETYTPTMEEAASATAAHPLESEIPAEELAAAAVASAPQRVPGGPALRPYVPIGEELNQDDDQGRPFGEDVPLGEWRVTVPWPGDIFEAEHGIGVNGDETVKDWTWVHVMSLDDLRAEHPNARSKDLLPEDAGTLLQFHPVAGELERHGDRHLFRNHARRIMRVRMPWLEKQVDPKTGQELYDADGNCVYKMNRGRIVVTAHDIVLQDCELMVDGPMGAVPRIKAFYCPHDLADGGANRLGLSLARMLIDPQRGINASTGMEADEQRMGASRYEVHAKTDLNYDMIEGSALQVLRWAHPEGGSESIDAYRPRLISRPTADHKWGASSEAYRAYMERASRKTEVEAGMVPGPTTPAQALQIAREESGATRVPRVEGLAGHYEGIVRHGAQLLQVFVEEPRVATDRFERGDEFGFTWDRTDFTGELSVTISIEGVADSEVLKQAKLKEAIGDGLVNLQDQRVARIIGKERGVPDSVYEVDDAQDVSAEREFQDYVAELDPDDAGDAETMGVPSAPQVDSGLDDHEAHAYRHRKDMQTDLWRQLEQTAGWDAALRCIGPWKLVVQFLMSQPGQNVDCFLPTPQDWVLDCWHQLLAGEGPLFQIAMGVAGPTAQLAPATPTEQPIQLSRPADPIMVTAALETVLRFRAHEAAHSLIVALAMMPPPPPAPAVDPGLDPAAQGG